MSPISPIENEIKNAKGRFKNNNFTQHGQTGAAAWKICSSILSLSQRLNRLILPAVAEGISMLRSWFCFDSSLNQHSESWQTDAQKTRYSIYNLFACVCLQSMNTRKNEPQVNDWQVSLWEK